MRKNLNIKTVVSYDLFITTLKLSTGSSVVQIQVTLDCLMILRTDMDGSASISLQKEIPDFLRCFVSKNTVVSEIFLQFEMAPVEKWVLIAFLSCGQQSASNRMPRCIKGRKGLHWCATSWPLLAVPHGSYCQTAATPQHGKQLNANAGNTAQ